jgi:hypothetical protein
VSIFLDSLKSFWKNTQENGYKKRKKKAASGEGKLGN